jgi:hypothetical protein
VFFSREKNRRDFYVPASKTPESKTSNSVHRAESSREQLKWEMRAVDGY